jgi:hypothetical protein
MPAQSSVPNPPGYSIRSGSGEVAFTVTRDIQIPANQIMPPYSGFTPANDVVASIPPSPIVSTADDGTITIAPFSLMAS